ncbi:MAG: DUF4405 domain-containing protein, partial [Planctomycetaceae bacterium]
MRFHIKGFTSLFLTIAFVAITLSGGVLYIAPRCRVAEQIGWTVMGLGKDQWESLHINGALFFVLAGVLHVVLNWSILWGYIRQRRQAGLMRKRELSAAVVLGGIVVLGSLLGVGPFRSVVDLHDSIKDSWGERPGRSASGLAPATTLRDLSAEMRVSGEQILVALEAEGLDVPGIGATLCEVGERNEMTPEAIRALVQHYFSQHRSSPGRGEGGGGGRGAGLGGGGGMGGGGGIARGGPGGCG